MTSSDKDNNEGWDTYMDYEADPFLTTQEGEIIKTSDKFNE